MSKWLIMLVLSVLLISLQAQPWSYDFGTATGSFSTNNSASTDFLPAPGENGGTARVRVSNNQGGSFNLENQEITFGSDSYLRIVGPTGTSVNKFSIYDYIAGNTFTIRFLIRLGGEDGEELGLSANDGIWSFYIGDGATFSDNSNFTAAQLFTGIQWVFNSDASITTNYRIGTNWVLLSSTDFEQAQDHIVEIYGNNSDVEESYTYGTPQTLATNTFDIWVDGVLVGDDLSKTAGLENNADIDSWMFIGTSSSSNVANIFVDNIIYTNEIASDPLPVELTSFEGKYANNSVQLNWETATETNNAGFQVQRQNSEPGTQNSEWEVLDFVVGHGTTNSPKYYSYVDEDLPNADKLYYRLKQIDIDGTSAYSKTVEVDLSGVTSVDEENIQYDFALEQNYPNPFNPVTTINFTLPNAGTTHELSLQAKLTVYNLLGQEVRTLFNEVKPVGSYQVQFDASDLPSGIYFYTLTYGNNIQTRKLALLK